MTVADSRRPVLLGHLIATFFTARPEPEPDLLVIGPCDRATEPEPEAEL